jgi:hypothetical protein
LTAQLTAGQHHCPVLVETGTGRYRLDERGTVQLDGMCILLSVETACTWRALIALLDYDSFPFRVHEQPDIQWIGKPLERAAM